MLLRKETASKDQLPMKSQWPNITKGKCYAPSSISVHLGCRGHTCCPHVMLLFLVPVPGTFLLLFPSDIPLAIVPCNEVAPHFMSHGGPSPFLLVPTPIPVPQLVYKLQ